MPLFHLFLDETGSRRLDKLEKTANEHPRWFAIGGVIVADEDMDRCRDELAAFCSRWPELVPPLHLTDMRARRKHFSWLERLDGAEQSRFWADYHDFLAGLPVTGMACVVHRPGYLARGYGRGEGQAKWDLCKSAFNIVVERSAKYAADQGRRLKVVFERSDKDTDHRMKAYFALLKDRGTQFNAERSAKYSPMGTADLVSTLVGIEPKPKDAKLLQIADSYVYGISKGRYEPSFTLFERIRDQGRLMDDQIDAEKVPTRGIKYYCFDGA